MSIFKLGLFLVSVFASSSSSSSSSVNATNVATVVRSNPELTSFSAFLDALVISPGFGETILAPSNAAFDRYASDFPRFWGLYQKPEWRLHLREILLWHLVTEGTFTTDQIFDGTRTKMENARGNITIDQNIDSFDDLPRSLIVSPNITATDGVVHVVDAVIIPPYMRLNLIEQMLDDQSLRYAFSTMANLALYIGLDDEINMLYENGFTFLVPLNVRFDRAEVNVKALMTPENLDYAIDFVRSHIIHGRNFYESTVFAMQQQAGVQQMLVTSLLGTHMWITTTLTKIKLKLQSRGGWRTKPS